MNRKQRRMKGRALPPVPVDARGEVLGLSLAEIRTAARAAEVMQAVVRELTTMYPDLPSNETVSLTNEAHGHISTCLATAEAASIPADSVLVLPMKTLQMMMGTVLAVQRASAAHAAEIQATQPDCPNFDTLTSTLAGQQLPPMADLAALEAKLNGIADALRGPAGMKA